MLSRRLLSAAIILTCLFTLIWLEIYLGKQTGHLGIIFTPIVLLVGLAASDELRNMWSARNDAPNFWVTLIGTGMIILSSCLPALWQQYPVDCSVGKLGWTLFGFATAVGLAFLYEMTTYDGTGHGHIGSRIARSVLIFGYVGILLSFVSAIRFHDSTSAANQIGMFAFVSVAAVVKISDSAAYFTGRAIGKRKMWPKLSPGKTVAGTIGGIIGGILGALFVFLVVSKLFVDRDEPFTWWAVMMFGLMVSIAGMIGDLAESLLKRESETKDSSSWLPGLGGVMDIIDSVLVAAPVAYAFWVSGLLD